MSASAGARAVHHRDRHRAVQRHDGRGLQALEKVVEADDLRPVRLLGARRLAMQGRDRRLQRERAGAAAKRLLDQRQRLGDLRVIPAAAILLLEHDEIAGRVETRLAPRIVQQHEREERRRFRRRLRRHQRPHQAPETDGLGAEVGPHERLAARGRVAFVEDEIDHRQHGVEPRGHVVRVGHGVRNAARRESCASRAPAAAPSSLPARETRARSRRSRGRPACAASARPAPRAPAPGGSR